MPNLSEFDACPKCVNGELHFSDDQSKLQCNMCSFEQSLGLPEQKYRRCPTCGSSAKQTKDKGVWLCPICQMLLA